MIVFSVVVAIVVLIWILCIIGTEPFERDITFVLGGITSIIAIVIAYAIIDTMHHRAAFDKIVSCKTKRMYYERKMLTTNVVCIPAMLQTRNDTVTANIISK